MLDKITSIFTAWNNKIPEMEPRDAFAFRMMRWYSLWSLLMVALITYMNFRLIEFVLGPVSAVGLPS